VVVCTCVSDRANAFSWRRSRETGLTTGSPPRNATARMVVAPAFDAGKRNHPMDDNNNREKGAGHEAKGALKESVGKLTDNQSQRIEGNLEKNAGKVQKEFGKATDDDSRRSTR
jgi:uncharacterized protein YjbJ (UPF0337 family)